MIPLAYFGARLSIVDFKSHRLPNKCVGWFVAVEILIMGITGWMASDFARLLTALGIAAATMVSFLLLFVLSRGSLGMGDVKFAFPLGLCVGWYAPGAAGNLHFISHCWSGGSHRISNQANDPKIKTRFWSLHVSWHFSSLCI